MATSRSATAPVLRPELDEQRAPGCPLTLTNLIRQVCFERFLDSVSIRGVGFGQVSLGDQQVDDCIRYVNGEVL